LEMIMRHTLTPQRLAWTLVVLAGLVLSTLFWQRPTTAAQTTTNTPTRTATATPTRTLTPTITHTPTVTRTPTPSITYKVVYGDTLLSIARKFGVTLEALMLANNLKDDRIYAGEILYIPNPGPAPTATRTPTPPPGGLYVVKAGDQLLRIARQFGVTLSALRAANGLTTNDIYVGQVLVIPLPGPTPTPLPPGSVYVVQPGDQLLRIARRFGVNFSALLAANGLKTDSVITPGQTLIIPTPIPVNVPTSTITPIASGNSYVVQRGDSLTRIAAMFGVTNEAIKTANKLGDTALQVGQVLTIPNPTRHPLQYTVQRGDSLTSIALKFETTVETLKIINRMTAEQNTVFAGLILIVPSK
jgi:peptidoglycan endopeptidase LytF